MSDDTYTYGLLEFAPPLRWIDYRDARDAIHNPVGNAEGTSMLVLVEDVDTRETDEGSVTARTAIAVAPRYDGMTSGRTWGKTSTLEDELDHLVRLAHAAGSWLEGYLYTRWTGGFGEITRWWVERYPSWPQTPWQIRHEESVLVWPDGREGWTSTPGEPLYAGGPPSEVWTPGSGPQRFAPLSPMG